MILSLPAADLSTYVRKQMENLFPDGTNLSDLPRFIDIALGRVEHCFAHLNLKGYRDQNRSRFNHRHSDQYAVFLYYLANSAFQERPGHPVADKAYALNKALHGLDAFYEVELPDIFVVQHPVGTVLGRANYADYFLVYQNCTVGANLNGDHPSFGQGVVMYGGSRVIGKTAIGDNTLISNGALVMDRGVLPAASVLHGIGERSRSRRDVIADIFCSSMEEEVAS